MTTWAYRDGLLAVDSIAMEGSYLLGSVTKVVKTETHLLTGSGCLGQLESFFEWGKAGFPQAAVPEFDYEEFDPFAVERATGATFYLVQDRTLEISAPFFSGGSGSKFARGAMAAGASAEQAVRIAMQFDPGTGGKIIVEGIA